MRKLFFITFLTLSPFILFAPNAESHKTNPSETSHTTVTTQVSNSITNPNFTAEENAKATDLLAKILPLGTAAEIDPIRSKLQNNSDFYTSMGEANSFLISHNAIVNSNDPYFSCKDQAKTYSDMINKIVSNSEKTMTGNVGQKIKTQIDSLKKNLNLIINATLASQPNQVKFGMTIGETFGKCNFLADSIAFFHKKVVIIQKDYGEFCMYCMAKGVKSPDKIQKLRKISKETNPDLIDIEKGLQDILDIIKENPDILKDMLPLFQNASSSMTIIQMILSKLGINTNVMGGDSNTFTPIIPGGDSNSLPPIQKAKLEKTIRDGINNPQTLIAQPFVQQNISLSITILQTMEMQPQFKPYKPQIKQSIDLLKQMQKTGSSNIGGNPNTFGPSQDMEIINTLKKLINDPSAIGDGLSIVKNLLNQKNIDIASISKVMGLQCDGDVGPTKATISLENKSYVLLIISPEAFKAFKNKSIVVYTRLDDPFDKAIKKLIIDAYAKGLINTLPTFVDGSKNKKIEEQIEIKYKDEVKNHPAGYGKSTDPILFRGIFGGKIPKDTEEFLSKPEVKNFFS